MQLESVSSSGESSVEKSLSRALVGARGDKLLNVSWSGDDVIW